MHFLLSSVITIMIPGVAVVTMKDEEGGGEDTEAREDEGAPVMAKARISKHLLLPMTRIYGPHCHLRHRHNTEPHLALNASMENVSVF